MGQVWKPAGQVSNMKEIGHAGLCLALLLILVLNLESSRFFQGECGLTGWVFFRVKVF